MMIAEMEEETMDQEEEKKKIEVENTMKKNPTKEIIQEIGIIHKQDQIHNSLKRFKGVLKESMTS
jgi:hypothetical protein